MKTNHDFSWYQAPTNARHPPTLPPPAAAPHLQAIEDVAHVHLTRRDVFCKGIILPSSFRILVQHPACPAHGPVGARGIGADCKLQHPLRGALLRLTKLACRYIRAMVDYFN